MKRAERLARHYIRAVDLRAVYLASAGGRARLAITRDPAGRARDLKRSRVQLHGVYWLASSEAAVRMVAAAESVFPGIERGAPVQVTSVRSALPRLAQAARVTLTDDATVQARATAVVRDIEERVAAMQAAGQLRGLNAGYRAARVEASAHGAGVMSYGDYLERYKIKMLYQVAAEARARR